MKKTMLKLFLTCGLTSITILGSAGSITVKPNWPPKPPKPPKHQNAPFDGGISLLIAAGVGYGVKKAHNLRKKKEI